MLARVSRGFVVRPGMTDLRDKACACTGIAVFFLFFYGHRSVERYEARLNR
jgi:hypothetical protein